MYLDGDNEDTEFFPNGDQWLPENTENLKMAHEKILRRTKEIAEQGQNVVIDYIIFGRYMEFIESFREEFGEDFSIVVLFPSQEELNKRDANRECWTTGADRIAAVYAEFEAIKDEIGKSNFLDTTGKSYEKTIGSIFSKSHD